MSGTPSSARRWWAITLASCLYLSISLIVPTTALAKKNTKDTFFGVIPKMTDDELSRVRSLLEAIDVECPKLAQKCAPADELYQVVVGQLSNENLPILVVYLDEDRNVKANRLLWKDRVTPYVYGVDSVFVMLFSDQPLELEVSLTGLWAQKGGIVRGLRDVFVSSGKRSVEDRESRLITKPIELEELGREDVDDNLWFGIRRFFVETNTAYRISIYPASEESADESGFRQIQANFTNSANRSVDFGLGVGVSFNIDEKEAELIDGIRVGNGNVAGYWMLHVYFKRPILVRPIARKKGGRYRPSYALTIGVDLDLFDAEQLIVGVNVGHLFGRHGVVAGANFIDPQDEEGRKLTRPFVALAFVF